MSQSHTLPETMAAIAIREPGGPDVLEAVRIDVPRPGPGDILVKVTAAGVNRPDVLQRMGAYPPPPGAPPGPGLEVAGTVVAQGEGVTTPALGETVCALVAGSGYAAYAVTDARHALPVPAPLTLIEAAGLPETYFTVWHNVFERGRLAAGETLLVHGGASGIGTTAVQLGCELGATVFATAGSDERCAAVQQLGATRAINYRTEDFVSVLKAETRRGADVILDMVGGDYIARNHAAAAPDGRIVQIAFLGGSKTELDFTRLMIKRLTHTGSTLRPQSRDDKARIAVGLLTTVWPMLEDGRVKPIIHAIFPLEQAADAHRMMEAGENIGKIILTVD
ncbi:MAG: NAD(P)H-quinone oxidoreductase [Pseudomonadota bacterium]